MSQGKKGLFYIISSLIILLKPSDWKRILPLLLCMFVSSILNAIGIAMVVPFIAVASNPDLIQTTHGLLWVYHFLHFTNSYHFLFFLGVVAFVLLLVGNVFNILVSWFSASVSYNLNYQWVNTFLACYLVQPYLFFLNTKTAEINRNLLKEINYLTVTLLNIFSFFATCLSLLM